MGLQIWLPLNGNLENKGLMNVPITNNGATIENNGKFNKCYSFGTEQSYLNISKEAMTSSTEMTVCFWLKILSWNTSYATFFQAGKGGHFWDHYIFGFLRYSSNSTCCFTISDGSTASNGNYLTSNLELNTWYHIGLVYKTGHCLIYINGNLYHDYSTSIIPNFEAITTITVGKANNTEYQSNCLINDLRIYDEALSPMQIKLISQGLVAHYLLNNNGGGLPNLFSGTPTTTDKNSYLAYQIPLTQNLEAEKTYTLQLWDVDISNTGKTEDELGIGVYWGGGNIGLYRWYGASHTNYLTITFTVTTAQASATDAVKLYLNFYNSPYNVSSATKYMSIGRWKLEEGDTPTPWCPNVNDTIYNSMGYNTNIEYDVSGYCHNGTKYNITDYTSDTPRYSVATKFNGTNSYINIGRGGMVRDEITVNIWGYMDDWTKYNSRLISCTEGGGWNFETWSDGKIHFTLGTGNTSNTYKSSTGYTLSELSSGWHMFTGIYDGLTVKQYVDGVFNSSNNAYTTKTPIYYHGSNSILIGAEATGSATSVGGYYFNGNISDVRIYATALSESDIQSLYNNSAFLDSSGNIYATEYTES